MRRGRPVSLRFSLLIGISLGWLVLVVALLGYHRLSGGTLTREVNLAHLEYEAELIADQLDHALQVRLRALELLRPQVSVADPALEATLAEQAGLLALFDRLMVFDAEGRPVAAWPPFPLGGPRIDARPYFRHVQAHGEPHVSEPYLGGETGIPQVMVIQPLHDEAGEFRGILGGNASLRDGESFLDLRKRRIGAEGHVLLTTREGQILSHPDEAWLMAWLPDGDAGSLLARALEGWEGSGQGAMLDGGLALKAFRWVDAADWMVGVVVPMTQASAPLQRYLLELRWVGVGTVALMLPLLWWLLGRGLAPLFRLERQIERVGRGEATRIELRTQLAELQQVAGAFNRLEAQRREALEAMESREAFLQAVLASSPVGMFLADSRGRASYLNPALEALSGIRQADYRAGEWVRRLPEEDRQAFFQEWRAAVEEGRELHQQYRFQRDDGRLLWLEVQASRVWVAERPLGFVGLVQDITERRQREWRQRWEAEHDPLTECLNRRGFERRLAEAQARRRRDKDASLGLIMLDLDHFKPVNDRAGHAAGDALLAQLADQLRQAVREQDAVARLGGDEFAVLLPGATLEVVHEVAERIRTRLADFEFVHGEHRFRLSASLGVAISDGLAADDDLLERADRACYRAKRGGRDRVEVV